MPYERGELQIDHFPDHECSPRFLTPVSGRDVIFGIALDHPDANIMSTFFSSCVARDLGARNIGFVIPYLPYLKRNTRDTKGVGDTARHFARLMSGCCDWILTTKPNVQHNLALLDMYSTRIMTVDAVPQIAHWITLNITRPVIFLLDKNSAQWVAELSEAADCPYTILDTTHYDDGTVGVTIPDASFWIGMTPVLIDEFVSCTHTMTAAVRQIELTGMAPPVCIAVHPLFSGSDYDVLRTSNIDCVVSCNSIVHTSNRIDLCQAFAQAIGEIFGGIKDA